MAILAGILLAVSLAPIEAPRNSADLDGHTHVPTVPDFRLTPLMSGAGIVSNLPVSTVPRQLTGQRGGAYLDDYYFRIHLTPQEIALGNIVSEQSMPIWVWNAWLDPRMLNSIDGLSEGVAIAGQPEPPLGYMPLQEREYQLSVTPDGVPTLDTRLYWNFDNGEAPALRLTANRIVAWPFVPDWSDGVAERLAWATDILASESLVEQRRALRDAPRREFEASFHAPGRERQYLDMLLYGWSERMWALPIWPDIQTLTVGVPAGSFTIPCTTANLDFRPGGLAMLRGFDIADVLTTEVVEVTEVAADSITLERQIQRSWPVGSRLYPVRSAQMTAAPELVRRTDKLDSLAISFRLIEPSDFPAVAPGTMYRGRPVLDARPEESQELTHQFARLLSELDSGTAMPCTTDIASRAVPVHQYRWIGNGRDERAAWRSLLYWFNGRQRAVWLPTHADDLTLRDVTSATSTLLNVEYLGYTRFAQSRPGRSDIRIELADGTVLYRRIVASSELPDGERMELDAAPGIDLLPANVARISFMALSRLDDDNVEIRHLTDSKGVAQSEIVLRGVRDDEF